MRLVLEIILILVLLQLLLVMMTHRCCRPRDILIFDSVDLLFGRLML